MSSLLLFNITNPREYMLHTAMVNRGNVSPFQALLAGDESWEGWNDHAPAKQPFNKKYLFSTARIPGKQHLWLFGGIYEVQKRPAAKQTRGKGITEYDIKLLSLGEEYRRRLILHFDRSKWKQRVRIPMDCLLYTS
ncbi:MAG: hypothetical protein MPK62_08110, partial [Alphaproteobacteria bacterium]|nr:hypothetical protein [Alphaproteobacteria bacterium]